MILKDKTAPKNLDSPTAKAGFKQEQDVAFFLRREFKNHPQVFVINDYKFTFNNETAQIDHLIVYPCGFILIESKSIKGNVEVNALGEWTRSVGNKFIGMPSPIKQVELQQKLLREFLHANRESILGKIFGLKQQSFGMRSWHNLCAVSSSAIIARDSMPNHVSKQLVKTEFLADKVIALMKLKNVVTKLNPFDTRPEFNQEELNAITAFLLSKGDNIQASAVSSAHGQFEKNEAIKQCDEKKHTPVKLPEPALKTSLLACKKCGEQSNYSPMYGRYGYFIKCNKCETNTAMKMPCPACSSTETKVTKRKETYTLHCQQCTANEPLI